MSDAYQTWRTDCRPGDVPVLWAPPGAFPLGRLSVPDGWSVVQPARDPDPYLLNFLAGVAIPADAKPGLYWVSWSDVGAPPGATPHRLTISVAKPLPQKEPQKLGPTDDDAKNINKALAKGGTVRLDPGYYDLDGDLIPPAVDWAIEGGGLVTLARTRRGPQYGNRIIGLNEGCGPGTVRGIRFAGDGADTRAFHGYPGRLDVIGCAFENLQAVTVAGGSALFRRCEYRWGAGTGEFAAGTWHDACAFDGTGAGAWPHAYLNSGVPGCLVTSCDWRGTGRGMVLQGGPNDCMTVGCTFDGIDGQQTNAGEVIGLEGVGGSGNTFLFCRARNCSGPGISLQGSGLRGNYFHGLTLGTHGTSVYLSHSGAGGPITGNVIVNTQCDGAVWLDGDCRGNAIAVVCRDLPRSSGNQEPQPWRAGCYGSGLPISDRSTSGENDFSGSYVSVPEGLRPVVKMPRRNGAVETDFMVGEVRPV